MTVTLPIPLLPISSAPQYQVETAAKRQQKNLRLDFHAARNQTWPRCLHQDAPWKVVRGFPLRHGGTLVHINNISGGIFGGDRMALDVNLRPNTATQITTTGATRLYRPRPGTPDAVLTSDFTLGANALLEYLPDPIIPFEQSRALQHNRFLLDPGATLFTWDIIAPGRAASGERFAYHRLKLATDITVNGLPILTDRLLLEPSRWAIATPARLSSNQYLVTFLAVQAGLNPLEARALEDVLLAALPRESLASSAQPTSTTVLNNYWGVSTLPAHGVIVRGAVPTSADIPAILNRLWATAKLHLCNRPIDAPRKTY